MHDSLGQATFMTKYGRARIRMWLALGLPVEIRWGRGQYETWYVDLEDRSRWWPVTTDEDSCVPGMLETEQQDGRVCRLIR